MLSTDASFSTPSPLFNMTMDERHYDRSSDEVILYAQCHCRKQTIPIRVAKSHFPLSAE